MIKSKLSLLALVTLGAVALSTSAKAAAYTAGDLIVGFRATGGIGNTKNLLVNLGSATTIRDLNGTNSLSLATVGVDLDGTFGLGAGNGVAWYDRTDLVWGVVANYTAASGGTVNGDPAKTIYATRTRTAEGTVGSANSSSLNISSNTNQGSTATAINSLAVSTFAAATASVNNSKVVIVDTVTGSFTANNWSTNTATGSNDFGGIVGSVEQAFTAGAWSTGTLGAASGVEGALDLYRVAATGGSSTGTFESSFVINQSGVISAINAVPEPSTYAMLGLVAAGAAVVAVRRRKLKA